MLTNFGVVMTNAFVELCDRIGSLARNFLWTLWQDLRYAVHTLTRARAFSIVAVVSLALGIGANTALFSLMNVMLLRALPVKNAERLVEFGRVDGQTIMTNLPYSVFKYLQHDRTVLEDVFAVYPSERVFRVGPAAPERVYCDVVSGSFFQALGIKALIGRAIFPDNEGTGADRAIVLSYGFWARRFGQNPSIIGTTARVNGELLTIVGVMPREFWGGSLRGSRFVGAVCGHSSTAGPNVGAGSLESGYLDDAGAHGAGTVIRSGTGVFRQ